MTQVQLQQLQKQLWNIANTLRGTMGRMNFGITFWGLFSLNIYRKSQLILPMSC